MTVPANGTYDDPTPLTFTVKFTEIVIVTGTPRLTLTVGASTKYAAYASGSGTDTLTFTYVLETGLTDANGIACASSIDLNSGTIKDAIGYNASLSITVPSLAGVLVAS